MKKEERQRIREIIGKLFYQTSEGIHTYGPCDCGRSVARGGGTCDVCLMEQLEEAIQKGVEFRVKFEPSPSHQSWEDTTGIYGKIDQGSSRFKKVAILRANLLAIAKALGKFEESVDRNDNSKKRKDKP